MSFKFRPLHLGISVGNLDEALVWYENMLGFRFLRLDTLPNLPFKIAFMEKDGFELELFEADEPIPLAAANKHPNTDNAYIGTKHICFFTEDVLALAAEFKAKGGEIVIGPQNMGDTSMFFLRDPWGICIEFMGPNIALE